MLDKGRKHVLHATGGQSTAYYPGPRTPRFERASGAKPANQLAPTVLPLTEINVRQRSFSFDTAFTDAQML